MLKVVSTGLLVLVAGCGIAQADDLALGTAERAPTVLAANGCGPGFFRTIAGDCEPNARLRVGPGGRVMAPPPCPRGYLRDPDPARPLCYPVY
jgi:hypothetical protein